MNDRSVDPDTHLGGRLKELLQHIDVSDIRFTQYSGELLVDKPGAIDSAHSNVSVQTRHDDTGFDLKCVFEVRLRSEDVSVAIIDIAIVQSFVLDQPSWDQVLREEGVTRGFAERVAFSSITPRFREALQSICVRLGLGPITLGLVQPIPGAE